MFPLLLVANPFGEFMIESYISLPILTYQCFIYMIIYICVYACIIQNYDTKASAYPCAMVRPWAIYVYFSIKRYGHPLITRGQCTGESHHFCAISVLLKNHHTMHGPKVKSQFGAFHFHGPAVMALQSHGHPLEGNWGIRRVSRVSPRETSQRSATGSTRPCAYPSTSAPSIPWILCCWAIASAPA